MLPCLDTPLVANADDTVRRSRGIILSGAPQPIGIATVALAWDTDVLGTAVDLDSLAGISWGLPVEDLYVYDDGLYQAEIRLLCTGVTALRSVRFDLQLTRAGVIIGNQFSHDFLMRADGGTTDCRAESVALPLQEGDVLLAFVSPAFAGGTYKPAIAMRMIGTWPA